MRKALISLLLTASLFAAPAADAAKRGFPITVGERSRQVCDALWLLGAHKPSVYRTPRLDVWDIRVPNNRPCVYSEYAAKATQKLKFRLGYPQRFIKGYFGKQLREYLLGHQLRPAYFLQLMSKRAKVYADAIRKAAWANRLISVAAREVGVREFGNNGGSRVLQYQAITGARFAAWCVSFQQWVRVHAGFRAIANSTAGVFYLTKYAQFRGWIRARPEPGYLVSFLNDKLRYAREGFHIGLVTGVTRRGYSTIEGNANDRVMRRFYTHGSRYAVFIRADDKAR